jgi:thymidylate synthase
MIKADSYYINNLLKIKNEGFLDEDPRPKYKDGTPAHTKFITQVVEYYDISKNEFPITTLRNTAIKTGIKEIIWIYQKQTNSLDIAKEMGINWWDEWNIGDGTIGERYGKTVSNYNMIDNLLNNLRKDPFGRRHILNLYQEADLIKSKGLYPCCYETIWSVRKVNDKFYLDLTMIQRSNDYIIGGYINKIQYVVFQMMIASHLNYNMGIFCHFVQNLHVYDRHNNAMDEILNKTPLNIQPLIKIKENKNFYDYNINDFEIQNIDGIEKLNSEIELAI